jgi:magnesium and cobalt transporter
MTEHSWIARIKQLFSETPKDVDDLKAILTHAGEEELLEPNTLSMLEGVLNVQETRVKDVMVPRSQMVTIEKNMPLDELLPIVSKSRHSRYPVIGENKDEVVGILLAKDLLNYGFNLATAPFDLNNLLRPAVFIPESKRLNVLLQDFRLNRNHMAIVVDEYGRVTGLITIEDVLEEIVGEIEDEHDTDSSPSVSPQAEGTFTVKALTPLEDFNAYFNSDLEEEGVETIGGLVMRTMGHMPKRGETLKIGDFSFTVLRADTRRIYLLSVSKKGTED